MMRLWSKRVLHKVITPNFKYIPVSQSSYESKNIKFFLTVLTGSSIIYVSREDKGDANCCKEKENEIKETLCKNRWETCSGKTYNNARPHVDYKNRIALVHNGTIFNYSKLRIHLEEDYGIKFKSEMDSEVIANLIGVELDSDPSMNIKDALSNIVKKMDGTWGLAVLSKDNPDEIVLACNGSPMVIGFEKDRVFVASETSAFNKYTKNFISMKDGEIASITSDGCTLCSSRMKIIESSYGSYGHWTLYESLKKPMAFAHGCRISCKRFS